MKTFWRSLASDKKFQFGLLLILYGLFLTVEGHCQQCLPTDWDYPPELRGCPSILKVLRTEVKFPGKTEVKIQFGTGECAHKTDCNILLYPFLGDQECWPQFRDPERSYGLWSRLVINMKAVSVITKYCTNPLVPLIGPQCQESSRERFEVASSCPPPVYVGAVGPAPDTLDPCWMSYTSGIPCWMWYWPAIW